VATAPSPSFDGLAVAITWIAVATARSGHHIIVAPLVAAYDIDRLAVGCSAAAGDEDPEPAVGRAVSDRRQPSKYSL
jgi:hypothetical protein